MSVALIQMWLTRKSLIKANPKKIMLVYKCIGIDVCVFFLYYWMLNIARMNKWKRKRDGKNGRKIARLFMFNLFSHSISFYFLTSFCSLRVVAIRQFQNEKLNFSLLSAHTHTHKHDKETEKNLLIHIVVHHIFLRQHFSISWDFHCEITKDGKNEWTAR